MKPLKFLIIFGVLNTSICFSQVGLGTPNPQSQLEITASDTAAPLNTDGILIPRIDEFPATNPTVNQDSMMVFITGDGTALRGYYYWDQGNNLWVLMASRANSNFSLARATLSNNQALNTTGAQKILFNTISFDVNNEFDIVNNRFIASQNGYYRITSTYHTVTTQTNSNYYGIGVYVNGSFTPYKERTHHHNYNAAENPSQVVRQINTVVYLNSNDYVEISAINYQAGTVELDSFSGKTDVVIERIK